MLSKFRLRRLKSDRGTSAVELAFLAPGLLVLTMLIVQTAIWFHARQVAQAAAEQGARATRAYQGTESKGEQVTLQYFNKLDGSRVTQGTPSVSARIGATSATVTLRTKSVKVIPFFGSWPVEVTAGGPIEKFQP